MKRAALRWTLSLAIPAVLASGGCTGIPGRISQVQFSPRSHVNHRPADMSPERMRAIAELFESQGRWAKAKELYARAEAAPAAIPTPMQPQAQQLLARFRRKQSVTPPQPQRPETTKPQTSLAANVPPTSDTESKPAAAQATEPNPTLAYHPTRWQRLQQPGAPLPNPTNTPATLPSDPTPSILPDPSVQLASQSQQSPVQDTQSPGAQSTAPNKTLAAVTAGPQSPPIADHTPRRDHAPSATEPKPSHQSLVVATAQIATVPEFLPQAASVQHVHYIPGRSVAPLPAEPVTDTSMIAQVDFEKPVERTSRELEGNSANAQSVASVDPSTAEVDPSGTEEEMPSVATVTPRRERADFSSGDSMSDRATETPSAVAETAASRNAVHDVASVVATDPVSPAPEPDAEDILYFEDVPSPAMDDPPEITPARIADAPVINPAPIASNASHVAQTDAVESAPVRAAADRDELPVVQPSRLRTGGTTQGVVTAQYSRPTSPADVWQSLESESSASRRSTSRKDETDWQIPTPSKEFVTSTAYAVQPIPAAERESAPSGARGKQLPAPAVLPMPPRPEDSSTTPNRSNDHSEEVSMVTEPAPPARFDYVVGEGRSTSETPKEIALAQGATVPGLNRIAPSSEPVQEVGWPEPASGFSEEDGNRLELAERTGRHLGQADGFSLTDEADSAQQISGETEALATDPLADLDDRNQAVASNPSTARKLIEKLDDERSRVRKEAAVQLTQAETNAAVPILVEWLETGTPKMRTFGAYLLGCFGREAESALPKLRAYLNDDDALFRLHVAEAIVRIEPTDARATDVLIEILERDEGDARWLAAFALGAVAQAHVEQAVEVLTANLDDPDLRVRSAAALTLGAFRMAAKEAVPQLVQALVGTDEQLSRAAAIALACIETDATLEDPAPNSDWSIPVVVCEPPAFPITQAQN